MRGTRFHRADRHDGQTKPDLTKEQTEAIKQFCGVDEFYPNLWEVQEAGKIFKAKLATFSQDVANGDTSADTAINSAAVKVWSAARRYQSKKQADITTTKQAKRKGLRRLLDKLPIKKRSVERS